MFLAPILLAVSCTAPGSPALAQAPAEEAAWWNSFPVPEAPLVVEAQDAPSITMMDFLRSYTDVTGQNVVLSSETEQLLESQKLGLIGAVTVPPAELQSFFETMLIEHDFTLRLVRDREPRVLGIDSLKTQARNTIRAHARFISVDHLEAMRDHPAMLVTTVVSLPHTDVRQLSNSMRTLITDANTQQMLPAGNTNSMIITGFGSSVAQIVDALRLIDAESRANWELTEKMRKSQQGGDSKED